jgi:hypothetical protein
MVCRPLRDPGDWDGIVMSGPIGLAAGFGR